MIRIMVGDAVERLRALPDESVQCCVTSPPYWGLRSYRGEADMIGMDASWEQHLERLVAVFREVRRVLRADGTLWLNYGDAYAGAGHFNQSGLVEGGVSPEDYKSRATRGGHGLKAKDLMMLPARVAMALQADGWWLRSEIVWHKPNPMPESVRDRPTAAHEKVFLLAKAARYYYDADAVRRSCATVGGARKGGSKGGDSSETRETNLASKWVSPAAGANMRNVLTVPKRDPMAPRPDKQRGHSRRHAGFNDRWDQMPKAEQQANGANMRNVVQVATQPFAGSHFATFPPRLIQPFIMAGTSERGCCAECGTPWRRVVDRKAGKARTYAGARATGLGDRDDAAQGRHSDLGGGAGVVTVGFEATCDCDTDETRPCLVLDPFAGAGTTGLVAASLGRDAVLVEISPEYAEMSAQRIRGTNPLFAPEVTVEEG